MSSDRDIASRLGSIAEGEEEAESSRESDDAGVLHARREPPADPAQVYSVRVPIERLAQLRQAADRRGVTPSALLRQWMIERLDADKEAATTSDEIHAAVSAAAAVLETHLRQSMRQDRREPSAGG